MQNFVRYYEFTFFELDANKNVTNLPGFKIANSVNFSFTYNISNNCFNTAKFYLYNVSENTVNLFTNKNNKRGFYFRACYDNPNNLTQSLIFRGLTILVNTYRQGPDLITEITAGDAFFNLQQATIKSINEPNGISAPDLLQKVSDYLGVFNPVSGVDFLQLKTFYDHPMTFTNVPITDILDMVAHENACDWAFDVEGIKLYPRQNNSEYGAGIIANAPLISRTTGLVGNVIAESFSTQLFPFDFYSEQRLQNNYPYVTVTCLLRHAPLYSKVRIQCEFPALNGLYLVTAVNYMGEYRGNPWYTTMKLSPVPSK